jgi:hypothetical protein
VKIDNIHGCCYLLSLEASTKYGKTNKECIEQMVKRLLILILLTLSALLVACTPTADEAVSEVDNGRLVTVFRAPT